MTGFARTPHPWHGASHGTKETNMADNWVRVAAAAEVAEGQVLGVRVGDKEIAIYHMPGGDFCATDNVCSHEYALLSEGWMENGCIECPLHAAQFDIRTGKALSAPADEDLAVFEVKVEAGDVMVKVAG
jgi:nitrite reductase/ring-hydroxylating ferredoxin subunit